MHLSYKCEPLFSAEVLTAELRLGCPSCTRHWQDLTQAHGVKTHYAQSKKAELKL